jgi:hypothetical protein
MANKLKSKKSQVSDPAKFKSEKEEKVKVQQLVNDERTYKILGTVFLLIAIFLFIAFTSYLFTWEEDQDKVFHGASILSPGSEVQAANLLGNLGAYISHQFFYKGFGLASYILCSFFLIVGVNLLVGRKCPKPPVRYNRHCIFQCAVCFYNQRQSFSMGRCRRGHFQCLANPVPWLDWNSSPTGNNRICLFYLAVQPGF